MDPPPYDAPESQPRALPQEQPTRSIPDLYTLILANAAIIKPRKLKDDTVSLVVARTDAGLAIRVPQPGNSYPVHNAATGTSPLHFAMLLIRGDAVTDVTVLLQGEPQVSPEKALEWIWERTQNLMMDVVRRHGVKTHYTGCCGMGGQAVRSSTYPVVELRSAQ